MTNLSSSSLDESIPSVSQINSRKICFSSESTLVIFPAEIQSPDRIVLKADAIALPLAAGLLSSRLQARKEHPLQKAGYDYGDTLWGTGEGWGYFSGVSENPSSKAKNPSFIFRSKFQALLQSVVVVVIPIISI